MTNEQWMQEALLEAHKAFEENEVPVGTIIVYNNKIIGRGHNQTEKLKDPTAHAEIIALSAAANYLNTWRLTDTIVYTTVEPCLMCCGALILARIKKLVFGAYDKKFGVCGSNYNIPEDNKFNHKFEVIPGISTIESQNLLRDFFKKKRMLKNPTQTRHIVSKDTNIAR
jgi:tRNA(adenine34) deaminase